MEGRDRACRQPGLEELGLEVAEMFMCDVRDGADLVVPQELLCPCTCQVRPVVVDRGWTAVAERASRRNASTALLQSGEPVPGTRAGPASS